MPRSTPLVLYAVVRQSEAPSIKGVTVLRAGALASLVGRPARSMDMEKAALRHHRVVRKIFESCSTLVPFRFGVELPSEQALTALLLTNEKLLDERLSYFQGRVEMGMTVKLPQLDFVLPLDRFHALAPNRHDRQETVEGAFFEGCYLIDRAAIEPFWDALSAIEWPVYGSGPWAPYSFSTLTLGEPIP